LAKLRFVGNAPFFSALSEEQQELVSQQMHLEHRRSGEVLFQKGDVCTTLYLIKSGWVRLVANGGTALASQGPGSLVGETDLFLDRPRSIGATIASDAELWVLDRQDLIDLIAENPPIGLKLTLAFGTRLALFDQYLVDNRVSTLPFLSDLKQETLAAIARRLVPMEKKKGEFIVEQGQPPEALFIVEMGQVHLHSSEEGGDFSEVGPGESFGEMALLTDKAHTHSAQAATDVILWALPAPEFEELADEYPEIRLALSQALREPLLAQDMGRAVERLATMSLFSGLSEEVLWSVAERMLLRHVPAGEQIYAQGDPGDAFYLVDAGQVEISSGDRGGQGILARLGADEFFGEMALLTGKPRSATVTAATNTNLWMLYRSDFDDLVNRHPSISLGLSKVLSERLAEMDRRFAENHLRGLKLLAGLSSRQLEDVSRRLQPVRFRQGEYILREGDPGEMMYFIESGRVRVERGAGQNIWVIAELAAGDLFGEMALLTGNARSASIVALSDIELWSLAQADFDDLVTAYPNLALALSRLLSERLRSTDERLLAQTGIPTAASVQRVPSAVVTTPAKPQRAVQPAPKPKPARRKRIRRSPDQNLTQQVREAFDGTVTWFGALSTGAKWRLVLITVVLAWLILIAAPLLVISTLAAADVTNLEGAIAFVQIATPEPEILPASTEAIPTTEAIVLSVEAPTTALEAPAPLDAPAVPQEAPAEVPAEPSQAAPDPIQEAPTPTPWIIVITNTPLPPTDTPIPPTPTPIPPTDTPVVVRSASQPLAPKPTDTPVPVERSQLPRSLDPRLDSLGVVVVPAGVRAGQSYWRLIEARWQNEAEAGGDHTIYVELQDEGGNRIVGHPIEIRWSGGSLNVITEDKPPPVYASNFPMYNTLGSYSVQVPGLPSDIVQGLGLGTADQPAFTVHTNFFLTFKKVTR